MNGPGVARLKIELVAWNLGNVEAHQARVQCGERWIHRETGYRGMGVLVATGERYSAAHSGAGFRFHSLRNRAAQILALPGDQAGSRGQGHVRDWARNLVPEKIAAQHQALIPAGDDRAAFRAGQAFSPQVGS